MGLGGVLVVGYDGKVVSPTTRRGEKLPWHYLRVRMHAHLSDDLHLSILSPSL